MLVTLYCDASWNSSKNVGGWAVWLRSSHGRIVRSGECPDYCDSSTVAELAAIFAGLHIATESWADTSKVLVRSDCTGALSAIRNKPRVASMVRLHRKISQLKVLSGIAIEDRWVKGHQFSGEVEAYVNNRVDRLAYREMRQAAMRSHSSTS